MRLGSGRREKVGEHPQDARVGLLSSLSGKLLRSKKKNPKLWNFEIKGFDGLKEV